MILQIQNLSTDDDNLRRLMNQLIGIIEKINTYTAGVDASIASFSAVSFNVDDILTNVSGEVLVNASGNVLVK